MIVVWESFFADAQEALRHISTLPSQNLGGQAVYKLFRAKGGRVFVRCQRVDTRAQIA